MERLGRALTCTALLCLPGCGVFHRSRVSPPVIAAPPTKPSKPIENPQVPPPPKVEQAATPSAPPLVVTQIPAKPPAPPPVVRPKKTRRVVAAKAVTPPPAPVHTAASVPSAAAGGEGESQIPGPDQPNVPVLSPVLSSGQQAAFNRAIDVAIDQAQAGLTEVQGKALSQTQRANADRAISFIEQAQQLRVSDLVTAKSLADRAVVLSRALVAETR